MIRSYRDKRTADFSAGKYVSAFQGFAAQAERRLAVLNAATGTRDLTGLKSNRFEALRGDRKGQFSIRINDQWRICFEWPKGSDGPENVEIVDYH
jgi:proteic killer suppression protein